MSGAGGVGVRQGWRTVLDPVVLLVAAACVLVGSVGGATSEVHDIDERLYRNVLDRMQGGEGFYPATGQSIIEKEGAAPSQVRSVRTPVLATVLAWFPSATWRWLAAIPALGFCLAASALAGPDLRARRIATVLAGVWMLTSLPHLYLYHELWGAALVALAGLQVRAGRDGRAALLCLVATSIRELFGVFVLAGLLIRRDRRPWLAVLVPIVAGAALHAHWAGQILDRDGFDPPLRPLDSVLAYVSPGAGGPVSQLVGLALLVAAGVGFWLRRDLPDQRFLALGVVPLVVASGLSGRVYWSLTWAALTSAAAAVALAAGADRWRPPAGRGG